MSRLPLPLGYRRATRKSAGRFNAFPTGVGAEADELLFHAADQDLRFAGE
jgi:hypothetical protein